MSLFCMISASSNEYIPDVGEILEIFNLAEFTYPGLVI